MNCLCGLDTAATLKRDMNYNQYVCCPKAQGDPTRCGFYCFVNREEEQKESVPLCLCNIPAQTFQVKKEGPTKGTFFYSCGFQMGHPERCNFFQQVGGPPFEPVSTAPLGVMCVCGQRAGTGTKKLPGPNQGRRYYNCLQRRCKFFSWAE